jgi:molybdate-binding protein/DNA-binding XRE family transcriptional regulator
MATQSSADRGELENRLRARRQSLGLSQKQLAGMAGITRQAVCAVEAGQYSPATSVALQLARALSCRVEDLFSLKAGGEIVEGELVGALPEGAGKRAQVARIGNRMLVRPLSGLGELAGLATTADGLIAGPTLAGRRVRVHLFKNRAAVERRIVVGGCDPAMFIAADYLRQLGEDNLAPRLMGSGAAVRALKRGEVHIAGMHLADERSGNWNFPYLRRHLKGMSCLVVTFAHWEEGLIVRKGNPKTIRGIADLARRDVTLVNRESGSGARCLLDGRLAAAGIPPVCVKGYGEEVFSHLEVAARVKAGAADTGIGVRVAATLLGVDFIALQRGRYDLIIPKSHYDAMPGLKTLLDAIVSKRFRDELEALGGYDAADIGKVVGWANA